MAGPLILDPTHILDEIFAKKLKSGALRYRFECNCGKKGKWRDNREDPIRDHLQHQRQELRKMGL